MRRAVAVLMLLLLPLQMAWAVSGAYCEHEQSSAVYHFGHHAHVHQAQTDHGDPQSSPAHHPDCSSCHAVTVTVPGAAPEVADSRRQQDAALLDAAAIPTAPTARPERPKWNAPA